MPWGFREGNDLFQPQTEEKHQEQMPFDLDHRGQDFDCGGDRKTA